MANGAPTVSNGLVISGVTTVTTLDLNGDLDVDGHTNLDNVNVSGATTCTGGAVFMNSISLNASTNNYLYFNDNLNFTRNGHGNEMIITSGGDVGINVTPISGVTLQVGTPNTSTGVMRGHPDYFSIDSGSSAGGGVVGTASNPALIFGGDGNTGLYHSGSDTLNFTTAGSERLRIDSSGRLLINTTNNSNGHISSSNLAVQGADLAIFKDSGGDNAGVSGHKLKFVTQSGSLGEIDVLSEGGGGPSGRGGSMRFYTKANNTSSATERLRIDSNGHVLPATNNTYDLGSTSLGWRNVYMNDLNLSNMKGNTNDVDGTQGSWTIQEGKDDLYIINRLNGKKFKIKMEEIS